MKPDIRIEAGVCLLGAAAILMVPLRWLLGAVVAAGIHELGHLLALKWMGIPVTGINIGFGGAKIQTAPMGRWEELAAAGAGPMAGLILVLFARWMPCCAVCAAVQTVFNLLPVGQQDGKRILKCAAGERISRICEICTILGLIVAAAKVISVGKMGIILGCGTVLVFVHRKFACKYRP